MPSPFDNLASSAFKAVARVIGRPASWTPSAGGATLTADVFLATPTPTQLVTDHESAPRGHAPVVATFEFRAEQFPGLFEAVRNTGPETVNVDGTDYMVYTVEALHDGRTYLARAEAVL